MGGVLFRPGRPGVSSPAWHLLATASKRVPDPAPAVRQAPCILHSTTFFSPNREEVPKRCPKGTCLFLGAGTRDSEPLPSFRPLFLSLQYFSAFLSWSPHSHMALGSFPGPFLCLAPRLPEPA